MCFEDLDRNKKSGLPPAIIARFSELVRIKVAICDGRFIGVDSRHSEESQPAIDRLIADTREWLDSPCREPYFNGSYRDYALWMWNKLEM